MINHPEPSLDDLALYVKLVKYGSFSSAARATGITKSKISRRLALLEEQVGVRLLNRSTRAFHVTDIGSEFYKKCEAMVHASQLAIETLKNDKNQPKGLIKISSPAGLAHLFLNDTLPDFIKKYPDIHVDIEITNRQINIISEGYDIALCARHELSNADLVYRNILNSPQVLVASQNFINLHGPFTTVESLQDVRGIGIKNHGANPPSWQLTSSTGLVSNIYYKPIISATYWPTLLSAALQDLGIAKLPLHACNNHINERQLIQILPDHKLKSHQINLIFASRKGIHPACRALIDHLSQWQFNEQNQAL